MILNFKEMQRRVGRRISNASTSTSNDNDVLPKIKDWINERYQRILRVFPWPEIIDRYALQIVASQRAYALPYDIGQILSVRDKTNALPIEQLSLTDYMDKRANYLDQTGSVTTGDPTGFYNIGYRKSKLSIATAEKVVAVSNSTSDVTPLQLSIKGKVSGVYTHERIVLVGTTAQTSGNTFDADQFLELSLYSSDGNTPAITGIITVTGSTSGSVYTTIDQWNYSQEYNIIEVSPLPDSDTSQPQWEIWYRRKFQNLINDYDIPIFDCCNEIIYGAYSDALREDGQENEANLADQKFVELINELWASKDNPDEIKQWVPEGRENSGEVIRIDFGRVIYS